MRSSANEQCGLYRVGDDRAQRAHADHHGGSAKNAASSGLARQPEVATAAAAAVHLNMVSLIITTILARRADAERGGPVSE